MPRAEPASMTFARSSSRSVMPPPRANTASSLSMRFTCSRPQHSTLCSRPLKSRRRAASSYSRRRIPKKFPSRFSPDVSVTTCAALHSRRSASDSRRSVPRKRSRFRRRQSPRLRAKATAPCAMRRRCSTKSSPTPGAKRDRATKLQTQSSRTYSISLIGMSCARSSKRASIPTQRPHSCKSTWPRLAALKHAESRTHSSSFSATSPSCVSRPIARRFSKVRTKSVPN